MSNERTTVPFSLGENAPVRTTWRTLAVIGGLLATGFASWILLRAQVQAHGERLDEQTHRIDVVESRLATDHDILLEIRADVKAFTRERNRQP